MKVHEGFDHLNFMVHVTDEISPNGVLHWNINALGV